ncbi:MAG: glycoside hydrolase family 97 N-terminal domain-containing protein [Proteiniphilum sp.]
MKKYIFKLLIFTLVCLIGAACSSKTDFAVSSPDDKITAIVKYDKEQGTVHYIVQSRKQEIISSSSMGISTSLGDFTSGMKLKGSSTKTIDETYHLPQGKVSTYRNHANEQTLTFSKNGQQLNILFRVYNDGIAYRYEIPGEGNIEFSGESSSINLADTNLTYYGQNHPNRYGYESALGPIDGELMSNPVLAHLKDKNHFILMGQAATYGNYVQTHFQRSGNRFTYSYPLDQEKIGSVHSTLPFQSPWRMAIISPENPGKIVESYLVENLNPPTKPVYLNQDGSIKDWVKPGRVMWDFIARDGDKPRMWIDAVKEMGWEYYMADAGFANRWGGSDSVLNVVEYAEDKGIGVIGWAHTREFDTREKADSTMGRYADWGLKGAKIDFFDNNTLSENSRDWRDYEDTQQSLQMRDWIFDLGIEYSFLLELHGNTIPTGERRQYPNLMTLEGVDGMERRTKPASNDLTIPYVRNVMGPVSYTVIHFERSPGTHAYQLAMPIVYEAGLMIYAEHGKKLLDWPGREMIKDIPSTWDETKYLEGMPAGHIVIARRKGADWYIGGMTNEARTVEISLNFLNEGKKYHALIFNDDTHTTMKKETRLISSNDTLSLNLLERGGFALRIRPE